jgi:hypothetical protein
MCWGTIVPCVPGLTRKKRGRGQGMRLPVRARHLPPPHRGGRVQPQRRRGQAVRRRGDRRPKARRAGTGSPAHPHARSFAAARARRAAPVQKPGTYAQAGRSGPRYRGHHHPGCRIQDHHGSARRMTIPYACQPDRPANGYSTERKTPLRRPTKTLVALRDGLPVSSVLAWQSSRLPTDHAGMGKVSRRARDARPCPRQKE